MKQPVILNISEMPTVAVNMQIALIDLLSEADILLVEWPFENNMSTELTKTRQVGAWWRVMLRQVNRPLYKVSPSQWKPVTRQKMIPANFSHGSAHERDAMRMAFYWFKIGHRVLLENFHA